MMIRVEPPEHAGSREQARELLGALDRDLSAADVLVDCSSVIVGTPSFLDELVKQLLVIRNARIIDLVGAPDRVRELVERAATNREVVDRIRITSQVQ